MKAYLLFQDRDFDDKQELPVNAEDLVADLELTAVLEAMANGDKFLYGISKTALLSSLIDLDTLHYRQEILKDCLAHRDVIRAIYQLPLEAVENKHRSWLGIFTRTPSGVLSSAVDLMVMYVGLLKKLKKITVENREIFQSDGFKRFFSMIDSELDDAYFLRVDTHLRQLKFYDGILISEELGKGNEGIHHQLRLPSKKGHWLKEVFSSGKNSYSFMISERDDAGVRALGDIKDRGINAVACALAESTEHIESFFQMLQNELAFYLSCIHLEEALSSFGSPIVFPTPESIDACAYHFTGLYDISLALTMKQRVVGNDIHADHKQLLMITGANQGGKSTFLRSLGSSQLMMQAGMFVPAEDFHASICRGVFTHFKRKEDNTMQFGKLEEELGRISSVVDQITPHAMILFNESFASTNEREGAEIARQIVNALLEKKIKVGYVTHMFELSHLYYELGMKEALFLRADRNDMGERSFKLKEGKPLSSSFGGDVYKAVFNLDPN